MQGGSVFDWFTLEHVKTLAIVLGGAYLAYKFLLGYLMINVTLAASARRQPLDDERDLMVVTTKIVKGDRECLTSNELKVSAASNAGFDSGQTLSFRRADASGKHVRLSPGEETSFDMAIEVPCGQAITTNVVLTGWSGPFVRIIPGYWCASIVSEPYRPKER